MHEADPFCVFNFVVTEWKFLNCICSLMLDSANILNAITDKKQIIRKAFELVDHLTNVEEIVSENNLISKLLREIYNQPGLVKNIIFNLNQPGDDDPDILGY